MCGGSRSTPRQARIGGVLVSTHSSQARFISPFCLMSAMQTIAERILLLSEPHKARLSSIRASALALCSYIDGLTGSGATATVKTRSSCATARLRVGVSPGKRVIIGNLRLAAINLLGDDGKIIVSRSGID